MRRQLPTDERSIEGTPVQLLGAREYVKTRGKLNRTGHTWHLPSESISSAGTLCNITGEQGRSYIAVKVSQAYPFPPCLKCMRADIVSRGGKKSHPVNKFTNMGEFLRAHPKPVLRREGDDARTS